MMIRRILILGLVAASALVVAPAHAATTCTLQGEGSSHQFRSVYLPNQRNVSAQLRLVLPRLGVSGPKAHHQFGGLFILNESKNNSAYIFLDLSADNGPSQAELSINSLGGPVEAQLPATNGTLSQQGAYAARPLGPGHYLIVAFGNGVGTWDVDVSFTGPDVACPEMDIDASHVDLDVNDFEAGTHIRIPGVGHAEGVKASFTNPYDWMVGGMFAHMPSPFPPMSFTISNDEGTVVRSQVIKTIGGDPHEWDIGLDYTGLTSVPSIQALGFTPPPYTTWG